MDHESAHTSFQQDDNSDVVAKTPIKRLCVFCGSRNGTNKSFVEVAKQFGVEIANRKIELVYGGGNVGIMGALAHSVHSNGGKITGVIPRFMTTDWVMEGVVGNQIVVDNMHDRKAKMCELADGFIALPGGVGTLEEVMEMLTWNQLGLHQKPVGILNIDGYFDPFVQMIENAVDNGFMWVEHKDSLICSDVPDVILERLENYTKIERDHKWLEETSKTL